MASGSTSSSTGATSTAIASPSSSNSQAQIEARSAVLASLSSAGSNYDTKIQQRASDLHSNATSIAKQEAELKRQTTALSKETAKWQKELDKATKSVNDIGDVQNWAEMMERDFLVLEETLRLVEDGEERVTTASGGSTWTLS